MPTIERANKQVEIPTPHGGTATWELALGMWCPYCGTKDSVWFEPESYCEGGGDNSVCIACRNMFYAPDGRETAQGKIDPTVDLIRIGLGG